MSAPADDVVVLTHAASRFEADAIVALLDAHEIMAYAAHRQLEDVFPTLFSREGTAIMVRARDVEAARTLLDAPPET